MPELLAIVQCRDVNTAAKLLTQGLTRELDIMAPIKTIQARKNYAPHMGEDTKLLQTNRNNAQERAVKSGDPEDSQPFQSFFFLLRTLQLIE